MSLLFFQRMFGGTIAQANFMQLSAHSRKYFNGQKFSFEKLSFIRLLLTSVVLLLYEADI